MKRAIAHRSIGFCGLAFIGGTIVFVEMHHEIAYFRLLGFALVALFLGIATAIAPTRIRSAALLFASLAVGVTIVEGIATAMEPSVAAVPELGVRAPIIGWDNGAAGAYPTRRIDPSTGSSIYDITYTIDAHRGRLTKSSASGRSVAFLGDSFTFGDGVGDDDTMPQRFADLLGRRQKVVNLGVSGFSPSQVLAELQTGLKDEAFGKRPAAFVMLTGPFHIVRTACKESWTIPAPRYEKQGGRLVFAGACAEGAAESFRRFQESTASYRRFIKPLRMRIGPSDVETYIEIVAEVARTAKAKYGVKTIVPYIGGPVAAPKTLRHAQMKVLPIWAYLADTGYDDDRIIAELRARGVEVTDMTLREEAMSGHAIGIPGDGHPTPFANHRRAEMVLAAMKALHIPLAGSEQESGQRQMSDKDF